MFSIDSFKENLSRYESYYNPRMLFDKIKKFAKKLGVNFVYLLLILYYATFDKKLPLKDRMLVLAALGYFILPIDIIPDALPGGFADDTAAILYVLKKVWNNLSTDTFEKAKGRLREWFSDIDERDLHIPEL